MELERVVGTVVKVHNRGFQLEGHDGWLNVSKYANPAPEIPSAGQVVTVAIDRSGFVREIGRPDPQPAAQLEPAPSGPANRERVVTRLACMNTATAILSAGNKPVKSEDVLTLAARLEAWANR